MNTDKITFARLGMKKENLLIEAPMCPCGCGHKATMIMQNDEIPSFAFELTKWLDENCGIAFVKENTTQYIKKTGTTYTRLFGVTSMQYLREIVQSNDKYAIMVETGDGSYRVVE